MRTKSLIFFILFFMGMPFTLSIAQDEEELVTPEVHPDRTVTFRFRAPGADQVGVFTQFTNDYHVMKKDAKGVWSITLGPAEPIPG